ncbi:MAG: SRPBCC domain-containing protein [Bauldia sp.]
MSAPATSPAGAPQKMLMVRTFHAPRSLVWKAWTDPEQLRKWWGPHHFTNAAVSIDLRVGGTQRIDMQAPDGTIYPMVSEYREVTPETKLVLLNRILADADGVAQAEVLTTVRFVEDRGRTIVNVEEEVLRSTPAAAGALAGMEEGMNQTLERLGAHVHSIMVAVPESEPIVWIARLFEAPRELIWKALTDANHLKHWWGQANAVNEVVEMDARVGGRWRIHQRYDGPQEETGVPPGSVFKFSGTVLELVPPERIVQTFEMAEMFPGKVIVETLTLTALSPTRTLYKVVSRFDGPEAFADRDGLVASGMSYGAQETLNRLEDYVRTL